MKTKLTRQVTGFIACVLTSIEGVSLSDPIRALQFNSLAQPWLVSSCTMCKISICISFTNSIGKNRPWKQVLGALIVLLAVVNVMYAMVWNLQCRPLEKLWNPASDGECFEAAVRLGIVYFQGGE